MATCTWCGGDHPAFEHGALGRRLYWWTETHPFRQPVETCGPGVTVTLTADEIGRARERAEAIVGEDVQRGYQMYFQPGGGEDRMAVNVRGFGAEIAAAKVTGLDLDWRYLPKSYRRSQKRADLGRRTEVRNARSGNSLWASQADPAERVFLLVVGAMPTFTVKGWIEGVDLLIPERILAPPAVRYAGYFIDAADLEPLPLPADA